jgi:hypothetical protein
MPRQLSHELVTQGQDQGRIVLFALLKLFNIGLRKVGGHVLSGFQAIQGLPAMNGLISLPGKQPQKNGRDELQLPG